MFCFLSILFPRAADAVHAETLAPDSSRQLRSIQTGPIIYLHGINSMTNIWYLAEEFENDFQTNLDFSDMCSEYDNCHPV